MSQSPLFSNEYDGQLQIYEDTEEFGSDSENNYKTFLKINNIMKPIVSTQKSYSTSKLHTHIGRSTTAISSKSTRVSSSLKPIVKTTVALGASSLLSTSSAAPKFIYKPNNIESGTSSSIIPANSEISPNVLQNISTLTPIQSSSLQAPISTSVQLPLQPDSQINLELLMKSVLREVKLIRKDVQNNKCKCASTDNLDNQIKLNMPATSVDEFLNLEDEIKQDSMKEKRFLQHLKLISESTHEKYIRVCLKTIVSDDVATKFSWQGQQNNIALKSFTSMQILKEETIKKFNSVRSRDVEETISKWFRYVKDRIRRKQTKC